MRVCGGAAFSRHLQVDRFFRDARAGHVMPPTADALYESGAEEDREFVRDDQLRSLTSRAMTVS